MEQPYYIIKHRIGLDETKFGNLHIFSIRISIFLRPDYLWFGCEAVTADLTSRLLHLHSHTIELLPWLLHLHHHVWVHALHLHLHWLTLHHLLLLHTWLHLHLHLHLHLAIVVDSVHIS